MGDEIYRGRHTDSQPVPEFEGTPFTAPPPLAEARVALVTTAALRGPEQRRFGTEDQTFRVLEASPEELVLDHASTNFDRGGWLSDVNVVFPVERLRELEAEGRIGSVAQRHLSFDGAQRETLATIRLDSGPAAAELLRRDGVDVVVLTGV